MRHIIFLAAALAILAPVPTRAGRLDLDVNPVVPPSAAPPAERLSLPRELWNPGSPLAARGESFGIQGFAHLGNTSLAAFGLAESLRDAGHDRQAAATAAGFGLVTAVQLWRGAWLWREREKLPRSSVEFIFLPKP